MIWRVPRLTKCARLGRTGNDVKYESGRDAAAPKIYRAAVVQAAADLLASKDNVMECSKTPPARGLVLASGSPRRRELIQGLDLPVELRVPPDDEGRPREGEPPERYVARVALDKARRVRGGNGDTIVLGADTAVVLGREILGKPADQGDARRVLQRLRGRDHTVVTGVVALDTRSGRWHSTTKSTGVTMRRFSDDEIAAYVASGDPLDKAGGYAVQDEVFRPASAIHGCYLNVVGLPLCEVVTLLEKLDVPVRLKSDWRPPERCTDCQLKERVRNVNQ